MPISNRPEDFSPIYGNKFASRDDFAKALIDIVEPLLAAYSPGCANVVVDGSGACFDPEAISLEGFARPLWGLVPFAMGGGHFDHWDIYRKGLSNGTDPQHEEYWGPVHNIDQRQVELAAIGVALLFIPQIIWDPLDQRAKDNIANYLIQGRSHEYPCCNWYFFRVLVDLGLQKVGVKVDTTLTDVALDLLDTFYIDDGWYRDGIAEDDMKRIDYYNPFAMHFYGLIYASVNPQSPRSERYIQRADLFAKHFLKMFDEEGASVPFGRSLTYRFACGSFWSAYAFINRDKYPSGSPFWGQMRGLVSRHLRWWSQWPISTFKTGLLSVGYAYPNRYVSEAYNSGCSPYWALKMFWILALDQKHPFWNDGESAMVDRPACEPIPTIGAVLLHQPQNTIMLVSGPQRSEFAFVAEKYNKFAYSTKYGFNVEPNLRNGGQGVYDNMIAFSEDGLFYKVREECILVKMLPSNIIYSKWSPWSDVVVETWIIPRQNSLWHTRVHKIQSDRALKTIEGGFAAPYLGHAEKYEDKSGAYSISEGNFTGISDQSYRPRVARCLVPAGNTSIMYSRVIIPQLLGEISKGVTIYETDIIASPDVGSASKEWPSKPSQFSLDELDKLAKTADNIKLLQY